MNQQLNDSLTAIFKPRTVAIVGASNSPRRWGFGTLRNMIAAGFHNRLFPVNPNETEVQGIKCYPSLDRIPDQVDLAVIVVNTSLIAEVVEACIKNRVKGGIVITP